MHQTDSPRDQTIIDLLRTYRDLEGVSSSGSGGDRLAGDTDRMLYMGGGDWDRSGCDALDELLKLLRAERPVQWWHVTERYLRCESRPRRVVAKRTHSGRLVLPSFGAHAEAIGEGIRPSDTWYSNELLVVVETWAPQVRLEKVRRGVRFLTVRFPWEKFRWKDLTQAAAA